MLFNKADLKKMIDAGFSNITIEDEIKLFGDLEITFKKDENCLIGHCRVVIKKENRTVDYLITDSGYEQLNEVIRG